RALPQGAEPGRPGRGRRPGRGGLLRRLRPPAPQRGGLGGHLARRTQRPGRLVEGGGEDFWPDAYDRTVADRIIEVSDGDSFAMTRRLAREEALLVGGSSGMAVHAAVQLAHELEGTPEGESAVIVVLLPDSGRGYLTKVF